VDVNHAIIANVFEEDINSPIRGLVERQLIKKRLNVLGIVIYIFLNLENSSKKNYV
jgi:hypothetical protein